MQATKQQLSIRYRTMRLSDVGAVTAIESEVHAYPWKEGHFNDALKAGNQTLIMQAGAQIIGYAVVMTVLDEAHLLNISIARAYQSQGLGRQLLDKVVSLAQANNCINVFLEVRASNTIAIGLYESIGFNEMSIRRGYYPATVGREDAILMGLAI